LVPCEQIFFLPLFVLGGYFAGTRSTVTARSKGRKDSHCGFFPIYPLSSEYWSLFARQCAFFFLQRRWHQFWRRLISSGAGRLSFFSRPRDFPTSNDQVKTFTPLLFPKPPGGRGTPPFPRKGVSSLPLTFLHLCASLFRFFSKSDSDAFCQDRARHPLTNCISPPPFPFECEYHDPVATTSPFVTSIGPVYFHPFRALILPLFVMPFFPPSQARVFTLAFVELIYGLCQVLILLVHSFHEFRLKVHGSFLPHRLTFSRRA